MTRDTHPEGLPRSRGAIWPHALGALESARAVLPPRRYRRLEAAAWAVSLPLGRRVVVHLTIGLALAACIGAVGLLSEAVGLDGPSAAGELTGMWRQLVQFGAAGVLGGVVYALVAPSLLARRWQRRWLAGSAVGIAVCCGLALSHPLSTAAMGVPQVVWTLSGGVLLGLMILPPSRALRDYRGDAPVT